jgi:cob(I)alamin adenosyltransferase
MKGDVTKTRTLAGVVSKETDIIEGIGLIDEANAFIGLAKVHIEDKKSKTILNEIQYMMFEAGAEFAGGNKFPEKNYERVLEIIGGLEKEVKTPEKFIILEENKQAAFLSVARAVVRRCERHAVKLYKLDKLSGTVVEWLNKMSYLLYLLILIEIKEESE